MRKIILTLTAILLTLIALNSCATYSTELDEEWSEEYFFKTAQQAFDRGSLSESLFYYEVYLLRYPQNHTKDIAAEYERAYILYKQKKINQSELFFNTILEKYETSPYAYLYPQAYKVLSEKVLAQIEEDRAIKALPFFQRGKARKYGLESLEEEQVAE
jgi:outer membrane protein assembly factor BamD (BamD/ComL family)